jgi:hypothetical protein
MDAVHRLLECSAARGSSAGVGAVQHVGAVHTAERAAMCGNIGWSNAAKSSAIGAGGNAAASAARPDWFAGVNKTGHARPAGSHQAAIC